VNAPGDGLVAVIDASCLLESAELDEVAAVALSALEEMRARRRESKRGMRHTRRRKAVFDHYGRSCACCGYGESLTVDHIYGGGNWHRALVGDGSYGFYRWLVVNEFPAGFQTLCKRCNVSKADGESCRLNHAKAAA
jgi:hypothetical protein